MKIIQVLNTNTALVLDSEGKEKVVFGKGICWGKKAHDIIQDKLVTKEFIYNSGEVPEKIIEFMETTDREMMELNNKVILLIQQRMGIKLCGDVLVAISDHINFAIRRARRNQRIKNALVWEIQRFYPEEYGVAKEVVELLNQELDASLTEDEAGFIALHLVNAANDEKDINVAIVSTELVREIMKLIEKQTGKKINETSLSFSRLNVHVRYFAKRMYKKQYFTDRNTSLNQEIRNSYPQAYAITRELDKFLQSEYGEELGEDEAAYFTLHIGRILEEL